jgi:hypothetical protein
MAMGTTTFYLLSSLCICLSFFICWHLRKGGVQMVFQCVMTEIILLICNTFSECLIVNLTTSLHILMQGLLIIPWQQSPHTSLYMCLENFTLLGQHRRQWNYNQLPSCLSVLTQCAFESSWWCIIITSCRLGESTSLNCGHARAYCSNSMWYTSMENHGGMMMLTEENSRLVHQKALWKSYHRQHLEDWVTGMRN